MELREEFLRNTVVPTIGPSMVEIDSFVESMKTGKENFGIVNFPYETVQDIGTKH